MAPDSHSITKWIERLRNGDPNAAAVLWTRFLERMLSVARQRLGATPRRVADEEDVAVMAFERFLHGARQGRFPRLNDRNDLWAILFTLTERLATRQARDQLRDRRGGGAVRGDSAFGSDAGEPIHLVDDGPTPVEAAALQDSLSQLLASLGDEELRRITLARMEGYSNAEIAEVIDRSEVTVERRLRVIRAAWLQLHPDEENDNEDDG